MRNKVFINDVEVPSPTIDGIDYLKEMIYQEEGTGRNQKGEMIRTEIGVANKATLTWQHLSQKEYTKLFNVLTKSKDTKLLIPYDIASDGVSTTHRSIQCYFSSINPQRINTTSGAYYSLVVEFIPLKLERGW